MKNVFKKFLLPLQNMVRDDIFIRFSGSFCLAERGDNFKFFYELEIIHFRKFFNKKFLNLAANCLVLL